MKTIIFAFFLLLPFTASALEIPAGGKFDKRIKFIAYNPSEVVGITGHYGFSTHVEFAPGENILKIGIGDSKAWDIGERENHLFLRPIAKKPVTNMTVLTNYRVYNFALDAHTSKRGANPAPNDMFFQVKFEYPAAAAHAAQLAAEQEQLRETLDQNDESQPKNFNYWTKGNNTLSPNKAYDDKQFTYLTFANNKEMPAIYIENPDGTESLVNSHVEGDVIILHKVAEKFVLRKGNLVACVFNRSYDDNGITNERGTTIPGVKRQIKEGV